MRRVPQRTCIGCLAKKPKRELVRLLVEDKKVIIDPTGKASGRGAYLCKRGRGISQSCLKLAKEKNAFKKIFKEKINQARFSG